MILECFGSGSSGNMYVLTSTTGHRLVVDMGFAWVKVKEFLKFDLNNVNFIISHIDHGDHGKGAQGAINAGCNVVYRFEDLEPFRLGEFRIIAFPVLHNVTTYGFLINHDECGTICFITDSAYLPHVFPNVHHWLIEANYCPKIVEERVFRTGEVGNAYRVFNDHMSIDCCEKMLLNQDLKHTENIVLLHLSDGNSNEQEFVNRIRRATGKPTVAAKAGLKMDLSKWQ